MLVSEEGMRDEFPIFNLSDHQAGIYGKRIRSARRLLSKYLSILSKSSAKASREAQGNYRRNKVPYVSEETSDVSMIVPVNIFVREPGSAHTLVRGPYCMPA
jgi:hypothetical protein